MNRLVKSIWKSRKVTDGVGVKINRNILGEDLSIFDPFLMLDEIYSDDPDDYIGGFPEHPHRGFETVTYMVTGKMRHSDHLGNEGIVESGGVQWMTAGRGVIHSEMPMQESGRLHGFQIWINLSENEKMIEPRYQEISKEFIPRVNCGERSSLKVLAGVFTSGEKHVQGLVSGVSVEPDIFDVSIEKEFLKFPARRDKKVLIYVFKGSVRIEGRTIQSQEIGLLDSGDSVLVSSEVAARFLFLSAIPLREPIASSGPFVMNTFDEVEKAIKDFKTGELVR